MDVDRRGELYAQGFIILPTPEQIHQCEPWKAHHSNFQQEVQGRKFETDPVIGTIWQCQESARFWVVRSIDIHTTWIRMRWYHREAKIIRRLKAGKV